MISLKLIHNPLRSVFRTFCFSHRRKPIKNKNDAGIKKRLALFEEENRDLENLTIDDKALDTLESELASGSHLVEAHRRSIEKLKKKTDLMIIERKYFDKVKIPNLLTWSDKEQIRELHRTEPNQWTYEKLSHHFPATPDIIKKVVESKWKPYSKDRLLKHDKQVNKNWQLVRSGSIQLDPDLKKHISSFSPRERMEHRPEDYDFVQTKVSNPVKSNEFTRIVGDYCHQKQMLDKKQESVVTTIEAGDQSSKHEIRENTMPLNKSLHSNHDDTMNNYSFENFPKNKYENKLITLDELRTNINKKQRSSLTEYDKALLKEPDSKVSPLVDVDNCETIPIKIVEKSLKVQPTITKEIAVPTEDIIPMRIKIPADTPKGTLYKVKDIYYDTDGRFLYRVPGMK